MSISEMACIVLITVGCLTSDVHAQGNRLRDHFDDVLTDGQNQNEFYERLILAQPDLVAVTANPDVLAGAIEQELSETLASLLQIHDADRKKKQLGKQELPPEFTDSLVAVMLVTTMPDLDLTDLKVNRAGRDVDFISQLIYLVRSNFAGMGDQLQAPGPIRDIASEWITIVGGSLQGHQAIYWGLQNDLRDPCLRVARRILSQRRDSSLLLVPQGVRVNPATRDYMLRAPIAVVEKWGGESDYWTLLKFVYETPSAEPVDAANRFRATVKDQALGALIRMNGLNATDYRMRVTYGIYNNYRFDNLEDRAAALARFKAWWDFLPPWKSGEPTPAASGLDLETAIDWLFKEEFDDLAVKRRVVTRVEQEPEAAQPLLMAARNLADEDQAKVINVMLDRIATKLVDQLSTNTPGPASVQTARQAFIQLLEQDGKAPFFAEMVQAEPGLISAFSRYLDAPTASKEFYGDVLIRTFMRRENAVARRFQQLRSEFVQARVAAGGQPRAAGTVYPGNLEDDFFASLAALLFVRGEQPVELPTPLLGMLNQSLYSGLGVSTNQQKSPVLEFIRTAGPRGDALRQCLKSACLTADKPNEYANALSIALRYRMEDTCLSLARRVCDPAFEFPHVSVRGNLLQLAIHSFMSFGIAGEDVRIVARLLEDEQPIRLQGYPSDQKRRHIEIREFALIAAMRMVGRNPDVMKGEKISGYCPMKGTIGLNIIKDPERWQEIQKTVDDWVKEFSGIEE